MLDDSDAQSKMAEDGIGPTWFIKGPQWQLFVLVHQLFTNSTYNLPLIKNSIVMMLTVNTEVTKWTQTVY